MRDSRIFDFSLIHFYKSCLVKYFIKQKTEAVCLAEHEEAHVREDHEYEEGDEDEGDEDKPIL